MRSRKLDVMILMGAFQLEIVFDFMILLNLLTWANKHGVRLAIPGKNQCLVSPGGILYGCE